jgi:hypothetical protein
MTSFVVMHTVCSRPQATLLQSTTTIYICRWQQPLQIVGAVQLVLAPRRALLLDEL